MELCTHLNFLFNFLYFLQNVSLFTLCTDKKLEKKETIKWNLVEKTCTCDRAAILLIQSISQHWLSSESLDLNITPTMKVDFEGKEEGGGKGVGMGWEMGRVKRKKEVTLLGLAPPTPPDNCIALAASWQW